MSSKDQYYKSAVFFYQNLSSSFIRVTSTHVVSETYTWLRYKSGYLYASQFLEIIDQVVQTDKLSLITDNMDIMKSAEDILRDFADQDLSYTDAISMGIMLHHDMKKIFTYDKHFS